MPEDKKMDVNPETPPETPPAEPSTPPKDESSTPPEVKQEPPQEPSTDPGKGKSVEELQAQINNLNIALKEEREAKKEDKGKIEELTAKLQEATETMDRLKEVFVPEQPPVDDTPPSGLSREELDAWWEEKQQEIEQKTQEQKRAELIQQEIKELESTYDGTNGKPKYDDKEVLQWQKENEKLYLSPKEAFRQMKYEEILDYEVKQRQAGQPPANNVEQPPSMPSEHEPTPTDDILDEINTRKAVEEAIENAEKEM